MAQKELWNDRYRQRGALWGADPNQFVVDRLGGLAPSRVLDIGSGQGRNAIWLAQHGHRVTAVDISDVATAQGQEIADHLGVEVDFIAADLASWVPPEESFDLVLLAYMQAPEPLRREIHAKAMRALARGGRVLVVAHHRDNLEHGFGGPPMPEVLFDEEDLAADFAQLRVIENARVIRHMEKDGQVGDAIDVVFIGQKQE